MATISLDNFLEKFGTVFENTDPSTINAGTNFRDLEEWDSMIALSLIAMADDEFNIKLTGDDIRNSTTVQDLFLKISQK